MGLPVRSSAMPRCSLSIPASEAALMMSARCFHIAYSKENRFARLLYQLIMGNEP
jgi:hypothetical protein